MSGTYTTRDEATTCTLGEAAEILRRAALAQVAATSPERTEHRVHHYMPTSVELTYTAADGAITMSAAGSTVTVTPTVRHGLTLTDAQLALAALNRVMMGMSPLVPLHDSIDGAGASTIQASGTVMLCYGH